MLHYEFTNHILSNDDRRITSAVTQGAWCSLPPDLAIVQGKYRFPGPTTEGRHNLGNEFIIDFALFLLLIFGFVCSGILFGSCLTGFLVGYLRGFFGCRRRCNDEVNFQP